MCKACWEWTVLPPGLVLTAPHEAWSPISGLSRHVAVVILALVCVGYSCVMARIWCHLTTRTVLIEWQPILTRVVYVSTVRVRYAVMSLNAQRRNRLFHSIWVNRAPCGSHGENGPPRICQYPSATPVSISRWHFDNQNQISFSNWTMPLTNRVTCFPAW